MENGELAESYKKYTGRKVLFISAAAVIMIFLAGVSLTLGQADIGILEAYKLIFQHLTGVEHDPFSDAWWGDIWVWDVRFPRVILSILVGAGLAVGGAAMQSIVRNPLADPYTTGISSGAVFGVVLGMVFGFTASGMGQYGLVLNAFLFGMIPAAVMAVISRTRQTSPASMILIGTAISFIFSSLCTVTLLSADEGTLHDAFVWQIGTLNGATWESLPIMAATVIICSLFLIIISSKLNIISLGDTTAQSLGIDAHNFRTIILIVISLLTASIVSFTGIIGFLGLIVPHVIRMFIGSDNKFIVPASIFLGPCILIFADILCRMLPISDLPVGVVMSFIGGPLFLILVLKTKKDVWN